MPIPLVLYASQYGWTRRYAQWIAEDLGGTARPVEDVSATDLGGALTVVVGASDYAGKLTGAEAVARMAPDLGGKKLAFFTVSFGGDLSVGSKKLDEVLAKNFGPTFDPAAPTAHFRGGMDYSELSRAHRAAMIGVRAFLASKPSKSVTDQQMLDCYGGSADYSDRDAVKPFVEVIRAL